MIFSTFPSMEILMAQHQWFSQKHLIDLVPLVASLWQTLPLFPSILPPLPDLSQTSPGASETKTSPGQAVIFQSDSGGDLPFTSPLATDSSTFLPFVFLKHGIKRLKERGEAEDKDKIWQQRIFRRSGSPSCDLWPKKPWSCSSCSLWGEHWHLPLFKSTRNICIPLKNIHTLSTAATRQNSSVIHLFSLWPPPPAGETCGFSLWTNTQH